MAPEISLVTFKDTTDPPLNRITTLKMCGCLEKAHFKRNYRYLNVESFQNKRYTPNYGG